MKESKFTGGLLGYIGVSIVALLLMIFTLGIGTPWAVCYLESWKAFHTTIDGKKLAFHGKGLDLLVQMLIWGLLTIITLGIYIFWVPLRLQAWKVRNTHFAK